jgi:hypothetical protein
MSRKLIVLFLLSFLYSTGFSQAVQEVDICIYGGTSAGVIAAYTATLQGKSVVIIEPGRHLGGMSSGGLGQTDIGNKYAISGLSLDFYRRLGKHYGKLEKWIFEPHVAENLFKDYVKRGGVDVIYEYRIIDAEKDGNLIRQITLENSYSPNSATNKTIKAKIFMDCTYEGDLMARSGVSYTVGRESNKQYNETLNGVQLMKGHQFPDGIDPYIEPGNPSSGLLWGISPRSLLKDGTGDNKVQAYNYRVCLTNDPKNLIPISQPENYDPKKYELLIRLMEKKPWKSLHDGFIWSLMPNNKTDINNKNGFSTDMIGENWDYPEADYDRRLEIYKAHTDYTKGLFYFVGNDPRVPTHIRDEMQTWGYPKDEYTDRGNWSHQLYVREARRMIGELVMTQHHCQGREVVEDGIGLAAYTMDSHNCDRVIMNGMVKNEGNVEVGGFDPYPISYRAIVPKKAEASNLYVPVCLSATHIAYGSIRMEPVFMVLAQSAAVAAVMAIDEGKAVQDVDINKVQKKIKEDPLADGSPSDILVDNEDTQSFILNGNWDIRKKDSYGPSMFIDDSKGKDFKSARFIPTIPADGKYQVFSYYLMLDTNSKVASFEVFDGKKKKSVNIKKSDVVVLGQTRGEWVSLGTYKLNKGNKAYVEISNRNADGHIIADAVLFVPVK